MLALTWDTYSLQRIHVYFGVEELVVIVIMEVPLCNNLVYERGVSNYT